MKLSLRAIRYNIRNYKRISILALLLFVIGNFLMFTLSIILTNNNIRNEIETTIVPEYSISYNGVGCQQENYCGLNSIGEKFEEIGSLDIVKKFEYSPFFYFQLESARTSLDPENDGLTNGLPGVTGKGINKINSLDFEDKKIILTSGNNFTEEDILSGKQKVIISDYLAAINNLKVGDTLVVKTTVYDSSVGQFTDFSLIEPLEEMRVPLEIIGTFKPNIDVIDEVRATDYETYTNIRRGAEFDIWNLRILVPDLVIEKFLDKFEEFVLKHKNVLVERPLPYNYFELNNINNAEEFVNVATHILDNEVYSILETSNDYKTLMAPLQSLSNQSTILLIGIVIISIVIISLLIVVETKKRTKEFGIYLALGESKLKITTLVIIEIVLVGIISFSSSIITGNMVADFYSKKVIENKIEVYHETINKYHDFLDKDTFRAEPIYKDLDFSAIEGYEINLTSDMILKYFSVSMLVLIISTVSTAVFILKLKPKDLLLSR